MLRAGSTAYSRFLGEDPVSRKRGSSGRASDAKRAERVATPSRWVERRCPPRVAGLPCHRGLFVDSIPRNVPKKCSPTSSAPTGRIRSGIARVAALPPQPRCGAGLSTARAPRPLEISFPSMYSGPSRFPDHWMCGIDPMLLIAGWLLQSTSRFATWRARCVGRLGSGHEEISLYISDSCRQYTSGCLNE